VGDSPQVVYIVEHGDTAWAQTRQHEGLTDLPLSSRGQDAARNQHHVRLYCQANRPPGNQPGRMLQATDPTPVSFDRIWDSFLGRTILLRAYLVDWYVPLREEAFVPLEKLVHHGYADASRDAHFLVRLHIHI
jgi:hypothetical protein